MKSDTEDNPWITHSTEVRYDNPWIRVTESEVTHPGGTDGIYGVVHFKNHAVGVIPVDEEEHTWLVGQFRYALGTYEWEIPEGGCPGGESPAETAARELEEETGLRAREISPLLENLSLSNSVTDERASVFLARGLSRHRATPEDSEELKLRRLPLSEAIEMAKTGTITDAVSVIALLKLATIAGSP